MLERLADLESALEAARAGGGEKWVTRHHARGKLLPRERVEMLLDQDSPFLELSPVAAWGSEFPIGASVVTGIGVVEGVECVVIANDPTVDGGRGQPVHRGEDPPGRPDRLGQPPAAGESGGVDRRGRPGRSAAGRRHRPRPEPAHRRPGADGLRGLRRDHRRRGLPAGALRLHDHGARARQDAHHPPAAGARGRRQRPARPEVRSAPTVPAGVTGPADQLAEDERDGLRLARQCVRRFNWRKRGPAPRVPAAAPPRYDAEDLLTMAGADPATVFDPREVLARILDGSDFDEFKPAQGTALVTGWGELHGYPIGVLANLGGAFTAGRDAEGRALHPARQRHRHLAAVRAVHRRADRRGPHEAADVRHGAPLVHAVAKSTVPHLTLMIGATPGRGDGRHLRPRLRAAVPVQLAGGAPAEGPSPPGSCRTTASSIPATPVRCSASACPPCTARPSRAPSSRRLRRRP